MEKELRKQEYLSGTWIKLGNGENWCISSLPLGKRGESILNLFDAVASAEKELDEIKEEDLSKLFEVRRKMLLAAEKFVFAMVKFNYPSITKDQFDALNITVKELSKFTRIMNGHELLIDIADVKQAEPAEQEQAEPVGELT